MRNDKPDKRLNFLNSKEIKKLKLVLIKQFGYAFSKDYAYLENKKGKIYVVNKSISDIDLDKLRIDRFGIYLGERTFGEIRLSTEGTQLLSMNAKSDGAKLTNVIDLNKGELKLYFHGLDLEKDSGENRFILISYQNEIFSCARLKDGKILNYLAKIHRGTVII